MAERAKKDNKNMIIGGICAAVVVVVIAIVAVVLATGGANKINDDYFVSDGTKYVLTLDADQYEFTEEEQAYAPLKTHLVYTYSGDEITGMKTYAEYADAAAAQAAYNAMKDAGEDMSAVTIEGKYLVMTGTAEDYEGMTASDVKQQIEFMEMMKNMDLNEDSTVEEEAVTDDAGEAEAVEEVTTEEEVTE